MGCIRYLGAEIKKECLVQRGKSRGMKDKFNSIFGLNFKLGGGTFDCNSDTFLKEPLRHKINLSIFKLLNFRYLVILKMRCSVYS